MRLSDPRAVLVTLGLLSAGACHLSLGLEELSFRGASGGGSGGAGGEVANTSASGGASGTATTSTGTTSATGTGGVGGAGGASTVASGGGASSTAATGGGGAGGVEVPPSCLVLPASCGPNADEDCCASLLVPGGTFKRLNDGKYPATLSAFRLDRFEVTVGRFRSFVLASVNGFVPAAGSGKHEHLSGGGIQGELGWKDAWSAQLPTTDAGWSAALACPQLESDKATWTPAPLTKEFLPINCASWLHAQAFCIYDGGFLPSEAEWSLAATGGGTMQRSYPWGAAAPTASHAVYECNGNTADMGCTPSDILPVGSRPLGDGAHGHADLGGGIFEWVLDAFASALPTPCTNCAALGELGQGVMHGGSWSFQAAKMKNSDRYELSKAATSSSTGFRCARAPLPE